jgi:hypothetical protein
MMLTDKAPDFRDYELMLFTSPEVRCIQGLEGTGHLPPPHRAWVVEFEDYQETIADDASKEDIQASKAYKRNRRRIRQWIRDKSVEERAVPCHLNLLEPFDAYLGPPDPFQLPLLVDISCVPRGRLFALLNYLARCQEKTHQHVCLLYTRVKRHATDEEAYSYGIQDIVVVPGFNGVIRLRLDLLILILGFEGNRAYSLYKRLMPNSAYMILGDSLDGDRDFYLTQSKANNRSLLRIHGNEQLLMASRDPVMFAKELDSFLKQTIVTKRERYNVYLSCLGTKLQTLGAFWAIRFHPYVQILDSVPSRRRIATTGRQQIVFCDLGTSGLLRQPSDLPTTRA